MLIGRSRAFVSATGVILLMGKLCKNWDRLGGPEIILFILVII